NVAKPNAIFVNIDNKDLLFQDFVRDFSARMYYIMDPDIYFESVISSVENITDFFTVFTMFMIVCFVIIIFNNTILVFYGLKSDLAKIKVMGARTKTFGINLTKEFAMLFSIVIVIGLIEIEILSKYLTYVVLLTNYYKNIHTTPLTNIYGCVIVGIVMISSYVYYCYQINKIKIIEEIKIY
ncbi:MAG TPA: hypothetical protein PK113_02975, partial [Bacillota bacterium]|nr:hypothetical protein [Bacillota bacterium]